MAAVDPAEYLGLVHYLARQTYRRLPIARAGEALYDDLLQAGFMGLLEGTRAYDPTRGVPFVAFVRPRIVGAMLDLLGAGDPLSKRERRARRERSTTEAELAARLGRPPSSDELADALGTSVAPPERSLVALPDEDDDGPAHALTSDAPGPDAHAVRRELGRATGACLEALGAEMRLVMVARVLEELTLETLAQMLHTSKDRIWRLERAARRQLRTCLQGKGWDAADALDAVGG